MNEQLVSFKTAKLAKNKWFDEPCKYSINSETKIVIEHTNAKNSEWEDVSLEKQCVLITAPSQCFLQKWLREKYNIHISINPELSNFIL